MASQLAASIKLFDGSNWLKWSNDMTTFLRSQGLWQSVSGNEPIPADVFVMDQSGSPTTNLTPKCKDAQGKWYNQDNQVLGYMQLHMVKNLRDLCKDTSSLTSTARFVKLALTILDTPATKDPRVQFPLQHYLGAQPQAHFDHPIYPILTKSHDLADHMDLGKTPSNLCLLERITDEPIQSHSPYNIDSGR